MGNKSGAEDTKRETANDKVVEKYKVSRQIMEEAPYRKDDLKRYNDETSNLIKGIYQEGDKLFKSFKFKSFTGENVPEELISCIERERDSSLSSVILFEEEKEKEEYIFIPDYSKLADNDLIYEPSPKNKNAEKLSTAYKRYKGDKYTLLANDWNDLECYLMEVIESRYNPSTLLELIFNPSKEKIFPKGVSIEWTPKGIIFDEGYHYLNDLAVADADLD